MERIIEFKNCPYCNSKEFKRQMFNEVVMEYECINCGTEMSIVIIKEDK